MKSVYDFIGESWHKQSDIFRVRHRNDMVLWRRQNSVQRIDFPTRLDRARSLGYKAKQGIIIVRVTIRSGGQNKRAITAGRKPKQKGINKLTLKVNLQHISEQRAAKKYPNMEVLNSYYVGQDGKHKFYEVILVDPSHPSIKNDPHYNWLLNPANTSRVYRGLTSAGKKERGLRWKGKGAERMRPSIPSNIKRERRTQYKVVP